MNCVVTNFSNINHKVMRRAFYFQILLSVVHTMTVNINVIRVRKAYMHWLRLK